MNRFAVDLVVCVALGCDMFDCVFPTRTAVSLFVILLVYSTGTMPTENMIITFHVNDC